MSSKHPLTCVLILGIVSSTGFFALTMAAQQSGPPAASTARQPLKVGQYDRADQADLAAQGDRVFQQQCSRCHSAPQGFSPRISGTITGHMRVRASLSHSEEQAILRFLNP